MIVHVIGRAGSGKTTLIAKLVQAINQADPEGAVSAHVAPPWNSSMVSAVAQLPAIVLASQYLLPAIRLHRCMSTSAKRRSFLSALSVLSNEGWRRVRNRRQRLLFVDQGLTFWLNKSRPEWTGDQLKGLPVPDAVLQITVSIETSLERRVFRRKPPNKKELLFGPNRELYLRQRAPGLWRSGRDEREIRKLFEAWNQRFCVPPLTADTLNTLLSETAHAPSPRRWIDDENPEHQIESARPLREAYESLGIAWIVANNDKGANPDELASETASRILEVLGLNSTSRYKAPEG